MRRRGIRLCFLMIGLGWVIQPLRASIGVQWDASGVMMHHGYTSPSDYPAQAAHNGDLVQLIWSEFGVIDGVNNDGSPQGDDQVLDTYLMNAGGVGVGSITPNVDAGGDPISYAYTDLAAITDKQFTNGYLYVRAFDADSASIGSGTWYTHGGLVSIKTAVELGISVAPDICSITDIYNDMDYQVPEPGTMALFAAGALAMIAARRKKKQS